VDELGRTDQELAAGHVVNAFPGVAQQLERHVQGVTAVHRTNRHQGVNGRDVVVALVGHPHHKAIGAGNPVDLDTQVIARFQAGLEQVIPGQRPCVLVLCAEIIGFVRIGQPFQDDAHGVGVAELAQGGRPVCAVEQVVLAAAFADNRQPQFCFIEAGCDFLHLSGVGRALVPADEQFSDGQQLNGLTGHFVVHR